MNARISKLTANQLAALVSKTGMNQTEIISVAIDRMFNKEITMNAKFEDSRELSAAVMTHLSDLRFSEAEIDIITNWFGNGTYEDQYIWLSTASKQEIIEASQPAFE